VSTAYLSGGIVPMVQVITFVSRLVLLVISVRSVPFWLVFIPGSFMMVLVLVAAQPLLCMVSALSNTLSCEIVVGVSLVVSMIGCALLCCMVRFAFRFFGYVVWVGVVDGCVYCYVLVGCVLV